MLALLMFVALQFWLIHLCLLRRMFEEKTYTVAALKLLHVTLSIHTIAKPIKMPFLFLEIKRWNLTRGIEVKL